MPKSVQVQYYAVLREQRGASGESLATSASTLRDLYRELSLKHGFRLSEDVIQVAVNDEFRRWDDVLNDHDSVVFIPPVAGG